MAQQTKHIYDIIINGGGIVGFTLLNAILRSRQLKQARVLLIEQAKKPTSLKQFSRLIDRSTESEWNQPNSESISEKKFSNRVSSITRASRLALDNLGAWDDVKPYSKNVLSIKVWNYDYSRKIIFKQNQTKDCDLTTNRDVMFSVVENNRLSLSILNNIYRHNREAHTIAWEHSLEHIGESDGLVEVMILNNKTNEASTACAPLILGCDGFKSKVRDFAKFKYIEKDLNKTAVVGTVKMSDVNNTGDNNIAFQRFSAEKDTVAALLPLDGEFSSFVISAPNDYSKFLGECDPSTFLTEFNLLLSKNEPHAFLANVSSMSNIICASLNGMVNVSNQSIASKNISNGFCSTDAIDEFDQPPAVASLVEGSRAMFPLVFGTTTPKMIAPLNLGADPQIALLGDSSHRVHPLAGQGLNLGIQDAIELVKQLEIVSNHGERLFDHADHYALAKALRRYECKRQMYIAPMSVGILSMPHIFKFLPSQILSTVNKCDPIKSMSVTIANG